MRTIRLAMAQINSTVGDLDGNTARIIAAIEQAAELGADVVTFPELAITGYPPEDLLLRHQFVTYNRKCLEKIARACYQTAAVVGFVDAGYDLFNAAAFCHAGEVVGVAHKTFLPNYGVFDENRYFQAGRRPLVVEFRGVRYGVNICEDIWYPDGPTMRQAIEGDAEVILNINASPYAQGKWRYREKMLATRAVDNSVFVAYNNLVGGQDELVFDGHGLIYDPEGNVMARGKSFAEDLIVADLDVDAVFRVRLHDPRRRKEKFLCQDQEPVVRCLTVPSDPAAARRPYTPPAPPPPPVSLAAEIYDALVMGTRDYLHKNGFKGAVIGLSGGIDSALVAAIAADALGPANVVGVAMPSRYSSQGSVDDAQALADNLGLRMLTIPIKDVYDAYEGALSEAFAGKAPDVTEENIQARIRGNYLMALSNKFGWIVLTTGNKSEMSVGYATLYGDMAGGFAVIKDVPKVMVYELCRYRNSLGPAIPESTITKPPSAELRPDQKDTDSLPPYEVLDPILEMYVEDDRSLDEIAAAGYDATLVKRVIRMVDLAEYKRRQAPPGIKISSRAFGKDRRLPITNKSLRFMLADAPSPAK